MTHADLIHALDQKYSKGSTDAVQCPNEGLGAKSVIGTKYVHGTLGVHGSGQFLVCGTCNYQQPIGN
jgi:hypothetical protein